MKSCIPAVGEMPDAAEANFALFPAEHRNYTFWKLPTVFIAKKPNVISVMRVVTSAHFAPQSHGELCLGCWSAGILQSR
ncbi:hypothetical protein SUGI_1126450 [Cryptomeria japonica]|nr:hypothetical protein SUGI_1126450 [Cryptomeria japonica]